MLRNLVLAAEAGGEAAEEVSNPILPVGNELVWGLITFFVLLILMKYVLLPPVMKVMREREARLRADRAAVDAAESGAAEAKAAYDSRIAAARKQANDIVEAAREEVDRYRAERFAEANADVARWRDEASAEVAAAKAEAMSQMRAGMAQVAVNAASRVMGKPLDLNAELAEIEAYVNSSRKGDAR